MEENNNLKKIERVVEIRQTGSGALSPAPEKVEATPSSPVVRSIRRSIIWFNIFTAIICATLSLVDIWTEGILGDVMEKTWATFLVLGGFSLVIALIAPLLDRK